MSIHLLAVVVAAVLAMVVGTLWYGPLFGKPWMRMTGMDMKNMSHEEKMKMRKGMGGKYLLQFIGALVMAFILSRAYLHTSAYLDNKGIVTGLSVGFFAWLGFVAPVLLPSVLWEGKPWKLWWINAGQFLVTLLLMGALFGMWF